ncbi:methyl-accepting chemotaxis protein [Pseudorhodoferax soli]|uniref:Methyl-accepting chemotaxis sensory transducer with Pas/Pac sensor n=1 Tax=Pseudorhodoferax soli TaxID=545864 RepID=A0A368X7N4_9BURK|nr:PAS domain-containing methyl-accepting chemotaxis protein [Pseudorhodoferax soli]RCW63825.1 methyl-accepting chemotaxis sensory transducer with Pas/Pac sensor [Pseudorhodoferax soli]
MRTNLSVTQREYMFPDDATLLSTTDTQSHITYANAAFLQASGFSRDELLGQPHNLVRHPDMPAQAFGDLWSTLKSGNSWTALVKNRRADGDHYWVRANVTPVVRSGQTVGYMSVRTRPAREEVAQAEALYARFRGGRAKGWTFHQGLVLRTGMLRWLSLPQTIPVRWQLRLALLFVLLVSVVGAELLPRLGASTEAVAGAVALACATAVLWLEARIARPLQRVLRQAQCVASGSPGENVQLERVDEIGMVLRAVNQAGLNLRSLVDDVGEQVAGVEHASQGIARDNQDLSARTEQAASSLQQTAASMEQMTATVKATASAAAQAVGLAGAASTAARQGGAVIGQVVQTMDAITAASSKIRDIIGVIDGIAFQTNILALNAAVEAARAGEQGRGFAVVAAEVRALAQRSAQAAKEVGKLIHNSSEQVDSGNQQVRDAGAAMQDIVQQVGKVADLIQEIGASAREQSQGIDQVNVAVTELDQMTQQNAAMVSHAREATSGLRAQARQLLDAIGVFQARVPGALVQPATAAPRRSQAPGLQAAALPA